MKNLKLLFFVLFICSCVVETKKVKKPQEKPSQYIDKIDCNYFWPARQVHVCIKEMPIEECEFLFSSGQFIREESCYCDLANKEKNPIRTAQYIQYDCKH